MLTDLPSAVIDGTRARLSVLRKKIHAAQQQQQQSAKKSSASGSERSGHSTPKPAIHAAATAAPGIAGTPPRV